MYAVLARPPTYLYRGRASARESPSITCWWLGRGETESRWCSSRCRRSRPPLFFFFCHSVRGLAAVQGRRRHVLYNASLTRDGNTQPCFSISYPPLKGASSQPAFLASAHASQGGPPFLRDFLEPVRTDQNRDVASLNLEPSDLFAHSAHG